MKDGLKYVSTELGGQCVLVALIIIIFGTIIHLTLL